jgi:hypothetical protein
MKPGHRVGAHAVAGGAAGGVLVVTSCRSARLPGSMRLIRLTVVLAVSLLAPLAVW